MQSPNENMSQRFCPICKNYSPHLYHHQQFSEQFDASLLSGYDVVSCTQCGFIYADGIPSQFQIDQYYSRHSKYENQQRLGQGSVYDSERFQAISKIILEHLPSKNLPILDIGCATGELLSILKNSGCTQVYGIDQSPTFANTALELYGVKVFTGSISDLQNMKASYSFICLIGVLEHINDLDSALLHISRKLSKDSLLLIEVPDVTRFAECIDAPFQQFSTEHINFFTSTSLDMLMNNYGFQTIFSGQFLRRQNRSSLMPVVTAIYKHHESESLSLTGIDNSGTPALREYILASQSLDVQIKTRINDLISRQAPIIIWGTGTHTLRLLAESLLAEAKITAFVDSNPRYQGLELMGIKILSPQSITNIPDTILISSQIYQEEIERTIRQDLKMNNPIVKLY